MAILVTGGTGLIGSEVVAQLLGRGERVVVLSRGMREINGASVVQGDICERGAVEQIVRECGAEQIIHLAAFLSEDCEREPVVATEVNVNGTLNLLTAAVACGVRRFVFASSIALYGPGNVVFAEDTPPIGPVSLYGQTKQRGEARCARFSVLHGLDYVALRYGGVFGPGGEVRGSGMSGLRQHLKQTMWGRNVTLDGASGDECFQYVYVKDVAEATVLALDRQGLPNRAYNIAGPLENYVSLKEFHAAIRQAVPEAGAVEFTGKSHSGLRVSIDRIRDDMGFEPRLSVEEGLRDEYARGPV
jgi:UDP-glucose 4-epimerase